MTLHPLRILPPESTVLQRSTSQQDLARSSSPLELRLNPDQVWRVAIIDTSPDHHNHLSQCESHHGAQRPPRAPHVRLVAIDSVLRTDRVLAVTAAKGGGSVIVGMPHVERVFKQQEIDELGLRWIDRQVIRALLKQPRYRAPKGVKEFVCFAASEQNTCSMAGVDLAEYRETIRPRLMSRGLLEVRPTYGQALTERCELLYRSRKAA